MADNSFRVCLDCEQRLPLSDFRKNATMRGGFTNRCKPCLLARDKARRADMPEAERQEAYSRHLDKQAIYRQENAVAAKARKADYFQRNKARLVAKTTEQRRKNPERTRELARGWQARRRSFTKSGLTAVQQRNWAKAQKKVCYWCGCRCPDTYHIDHYIPLSKGGAHEVFNLVIACAPCNLKKNAKDPLDFAREVGRLL